MGRHVVALEVWKRLVVEPKAPAQPEVLSMHSLRLPNTNPTQTQTQIGLVLGLCWVNTDPIWVCVKSRPRAKFV